MENHIKQIIQEAEDTITNIIYQLNTDRINYRNNITATLIKYQTRLIKEYEARVTLHKKEDLRLADENIKYLTFIVLKLIELNKRKA